MGLDHAVSDRRQVAAVHPLDMGSRRKPRVINAVQHQRQAQWLAVRRELVALLDAHEPAQSPGHVDRLLSAFAGMVGRSLSLLMVLMHMEVITNECCLPVQEYELLACYRQYYQRSGDASSGVPLAVTLGTNRLQQQQVQLPVALVPAFLRASRAPNAKDDDVRGPTCTTTSVKPVPTTAIDLSSGAREALRPVRTPTTARTTK